MRKVFKSNCFLGSIWYLKALYLIHSFHKLMSQCRNKYNRKCHWYILYKYSSITCLSQHKLSAINSKTFCFLFNCIVSLSFMFYFCYFMSVEKNLNDWKIRFLPWPFFITCYLLIQFFFTCDLFVFRTEQNASHIARNRDFPSHYLCI